MRKILIILIIQFFIFKYTYCKDFELSASEESIFSDVESIRVLQWKKIRSIDTQLDSIKGKILGLSYISNVSDPNSNNYILEKSPLGLRNDVVRVKMNLLKAQDHLYLGDPLIAINIIEKEMQYIDPRNRGYISWANQILFEANRQLKNHNVTSNICLKMLVIGGYEEDLFPDKWRLSCSMEFLHETKIRKENNTLADFKENLIIWSNSPVIKRDSKNMIMSAIYISLALRNLYLNNINSISYLEEAIGHIKPGNNYIGKAYLALSLLKYEIGKKEEALSLIRFLSGDFKGYGENLKYFEKDDMSRIVARLCLARFHASMFNLMAAETWYHDVLIENKITGIELLEKEKRKSHLEYAHILYLRKNYLESARQYKEAIEYGNQEIINLKDEKIYERNNELKTSKFILAKILSKASKRNYEAEVQLLELLTETEADIAFLEKIKNDYSKSNEEGVENILALASLAEEYGIKNDLVTNALIFRRAYYHLENEISIIRSDLANAINVAEYTYSGILEVRAISSLSKLKNILDEFKTIILDLDKLEYQFWNMKKPGIEFAKQNRFELIKRFISMDDDISKYKLKSEIDDKIYNPKLPGALQSLSRNMNNMNSEMSSVNYLFTLNDNKIPKKAENEDIDILEKNYSKFTFDKLYKDLIKYTIEERTFQLSRSLKPSSSLIFEKQSNIVESTMNNIYNLHLRNREEAFSIGDNEILDATRNSWDNLFSSYKQLLIAISNIKDRIINERKEILNKVEQINNHTLQEEVTLEKLKKSILNEYVSISKELVNQIDPRAKEFKDYVNISLSDHNKGIYDLKKDRDEEIKKASEERGNWLNSLRQSLNMDLMR